MKKIKDAGIEVITFADKKPFQDAVKPVWDKYGAKYDALVKRIQAVQVKHAMAKAAGRSSGSACR